MIVAGDQEEGEIFLGEVWMKLRERKNILIKSNIPRYIDPSCGRI
jgi:hypothetical protein